MNMQVRQPGQSVMIEKFGADLLGRNGWQFAYYVSWSDYEQLAKSKPGEGNSWRAVFAA